MCVVVSPPTLVLTPHPHVSNPADGTCAQLQERNLELELQLQAALVRMAAQVEEAREMEMARVRCVEEAAHKAEALARSREVWAVYAADGTCRWCSWEWLTTSLDDSTAGTTPDTRLQQVAGQLWEGSLGELFTERELGSALESWYDRAKEEYEAGREAQARVAAVWDGAGIAWAMDLLGLAPGATLRDVRTAFRACSLRAHPDKPGGSLEAFAALSQAHELLCRAFA